jgi:hypothetical protein
LRHGYEPRAEAEGLTVEAYVERIARDDEQAEQEFEALALEGLNSGESIVADDKYWAEKRARLMSGIKRPAPGECPIHCKAKS